MSELGKMGDGGVDRGLEIEIDKADAVVLFAATNEGEGESVLPQEQVNTPIAQPHLHQDQAVDRPAAHQIEQLRLVDRAAVER